MSRTGPLVKSLAEGIRDDLGDVATAFEEARAKIEVLGESARAVNGLGGECAGWSNHLNSVISEIRKEMVEVPAKLLGSPINAITQSVNADHVEAVTAARRKAS